MLLHWLSVWSSNVAWCRILHVLVIYCTLSTYFWMLCEGAYLQLLLVDTFQVGHTPVVLVIYCTLSTYFWMLCEGAYLQILLVDTFQVGHT
jgi:hypothetical protein